MLKPIQQLVNYTSSSKGAKVTLILWIVGAILLSIFAPSAKQFETNSQDGSINKNMPNEVATELLNQYYPTDDGELALIVFHSDDQITEKDRTQIKTFSEWLASDEKPKQVTSALPFHSFPKEVQDQMFSEDKTTLLFNLTLEKDISSSQAYETLGQLEDKMEKIGLGHTQFEVTGPAGIYADTVKLFKNADTVLILATIGLIFLILILIYRSPLLAFTPLIIAGIVYSVVDRILGLAGKYDLFVIEGQALSIMLVLLFAVLTDYSLFVFSRYREELRNFTCKYDSMNKAIYHVSEPIFFSGGTVFFAMLTLFVTVFEPYHHFAPVFSVAICFILLAGLTLIPALFALMGRAAFWPFIPKVGSNNKPKKRFWTWVSHFVVKRPRIIVSTLLVFLTIGALNVLSINFSFNLLKSFPEDISSRQGFEILEEHYPTGQLAPVTVLLQADHAIKVDETFLSNMDTLKQTLETKKGVYSVSPELNGISAKSELPNHFLSDNEKMVKFQLILTDHPYEVTAFNTLNDLRQSSEDIIGQSGLDAANYKLHFAGQTAKQLDVKQMNERDMIFLFTLIIGLLTCILAFQTKSVILPILMMGTIVLSYIASLGFGWFIFNRILGFDTISYRLPVYTFIFMVALGIDYNIMLVSRIKELASTGHSWKEAIRKGVNLTGGVISSAGLILAATFSVLMTQPLQELFLFGFMMVLGILLDTFIIRGFLLPALLLLIYNKSSVSTK